MLRELTVYNSQNERLAMEYFNELNNHKDHRSVCKLVSFCQGEKTTFDILVKDVIKSTLKNKHLVKIKYKSEEKVKFGFYVLKRLNNRRV